ncbi:hypothetical protein H4R21_006128, partial [Coemansia helicoidea]
MDDSAPARDPPALPSRPRPALPLSPLPPLPQRPRPVVHSSSTAHEPPQLSPTQASLLSAPPLPTRRRPAAVYPRDHITTPPPVVHVEHATRATPPVRSAGHRRGAASLPTNMPLASALIAAVATPPAQSLLAAKDQASGGSGRRGSSGSKSAVSARGPDSRDTLASNTATPPPGIRDAATRDAHANLSCNRFSDNVLNFRDLGVSVINAERQMGSSHASANGAGPMAGVVFRSAELGSAGERDVKTLLSKYGIRTIIDLRSELEARANDILAKHYPATMQPTADESSEKLLRLRAAQLRSTIVEVAAHDYEAATRPWERLGESSASWSRRNSLRYSRSIGNTRGDPVARAMAHLYDP